MRDLWGKMRDLWGNFEGGIWICDDLVNIYYKNFFLQIVQEIFFFIKITYIIYCMKYKFLFWWKFAFTFITSHNIYNIYFFITKKTSKKCKKWIFDFYFFVFFIDILLVKNKFIKNLLVSKFNQMCKMLLKFNQMCKN